MRYPGRSLLLPLALVALAALPSRAETVSGDVRVIDGDSIVVGGTRVRIWGIDAPEMGTREGDAAKKYLKMLVKDAPVRCEDDGTRIQGRIMAKCFIGAIDIGGVMVMSGNAYDWRRYSRGHYSEMLKLAGITPRRRQVARRAPPRPKPIEEKPAVPAAPAVIESLASRPERDAARTAPAPTPALNRPTAARYPTAPAIVAEPPKPFRPVTQAAPAQPPVSAAPRATVSEPTVLAPPPQAAAVPVAAEDETPPAVQAPLQDE